VSYALVAIVELAEKWHPGEARKILLSRGLFESSLGFWIVSVVLQPETSPPLG
jgi:hypothetical protein